MPELHHAELEVVLRDQHDNIGYGNEPATAADLLSACHDEGWLVIQRDDNGEWPDAVVGLIMDWHDDNETLVVHLLDALSALSVEGETP
jgi:hypothetical protein